LIALRQRVSSPSRNRQPDAAAAPETEIPSGFMTPFETVTIDTSVAACDGGDDALGHPRVYLNLEPSGKAECPYCSRLFVNPVMQAAHEVPAAATDPPPGRA
jgi:uncharacterized Zn-finger protein